MQGYSIVTLKQLCKNLGEDNVKTILSTFYCPHNEDVSSFLKDKAIEFSNQGISKSHLVFASDKDKPVLVGYYALALKVIIVKTDCLSNELKKKIKKFGTYNSDIKRYIVAIPLIGQLSKNFHNEYDKLISGDELLKLACDSVKEVQAIIGSKFVYLECENSVKLLAFYERNGFVCFGERPLERDEKKGIKGESLLQLIKYLR